MKHEVLLFLRQYFAGLLISFLIYFHKNFRKLKIFSKFLNDRKLPKGLPPLENLEIVSPRVIRILGFNPGSHTLQGTNTYLVGEGPVKLLVDAGELTNSSKYISFLLDKILPTIDPQITISGILLTHGHGDHMGGVVPLLAALSERNKPKPKVWKRLISHGNYPPKGFSCENIEDNQLFEVPGATIRAIHSPGHTDDHVAFLLEEDAAIFSGDCVLGCGTCVFENLHQYVLSLNKLKAIMVHQNIKNCYPGHGPVIWDEAIDRIDQYLSHRTKREQQIINHLYSKYLESEIKCTSSTSTIAANSSISDANIAFVREPNIPHTHNRSSACKPSPTKPSFISQRVYSTPIEIVDAIYGKNISMAIRLSALYVIMQHLKKLEEEETVVRTWPQLWRINKKKVP